MEYQDNQGIIPSGDFSHRGKTVYSPAIGSQSEDLAKFILQCSKRTIEDIKLSLMGKHKAMDGATLEDWGDPEMNTLGIVEVLRILSSAMTPNIFLSVFTTDRISAKCKSIEFELNDVLCDNWHIWKLNPAKIPILREEIMMQVEAAFNRAREFNKEYGAFGGTTQAITQTQTSNEIIQRQKQGFSIPFLGGRKNE
jgi:hypothetical protein